MVGRRGRPRLVVGDTATPNLIQTNTNDDQRKEISDYEQSREERIQDNIQRMQKLGIIDLSLQLKSLKPAPRPKKVFSPRKTPVDFAPVPPFGPTRRSSRLRNVALVSYSEVDVSKNDKKLESMVDFLRGEGSRPEVYTEEHEKLLGSTEMSWNLFVDGCGKDGKRIYDPVKGKTCHQCRQKTLGHRTHCSKCGMVQGQFCGDCLYMRYGEHVLEANQNQDWICPVCRGICNCSLCRQAKGWPATGSLYRKISSLGYKSVAHYLVQTRRAEPVELTNSMKSSEPLPHVEELTNSQNGETKLNDNLDVTGQEEQSKSSDNEQLENAVELETTDNPLSPKLRFNEKDQFFNCSIESESSSKLPREPSVNTNEIAGDICLEAKEPIGIKDAPLHTKVELENVSFQVNVVDVGQFDNEEIGREGHLALNEKKGTLGFRQKKKPTIFSNPSKGEEDSKICSRFSCKEVVTSPEAKRKSGKLTEVSPDSIAGRLRQRRCKNLM